MFLMVVETMVPRIFNGSIEYEWQCDLYRSMKKSYIFDEAERSNSFQTNKFIKAVSMNCEL